MQSCGEPTEHIRVPRLPIAPRPETYDPTAMTQDEASRSDQSRPRIHWIGTLGGQPEVCGGSPTVSTRLGDRRDRVARAASADRPATGTRSRRPPWEARGCARSGRGAGFHGAQTSVVDGSDASCPRRAGRDESMDLVLIDGAHASPIVDRLHYLGPPGAGVLLSDGTPSSARSTAARVPAAEKGAGSW